MLKEAFGLIAVTLSAAVFYVDTCTEIAGAVAVLYVVIMLLAVAAIDVTCDGPVHGGHRRSLSQAVRKLEYGGWARTCSS